MDTKNNSDGENTFPINFQPMPKRFMVWDKGLNKFYSGSEGKPYIFDIWSLIEFLNNSQRYPEQLEIVQSTNLFDKDGKEIFEGSIVSNGECRAVCVWDNSNAEFDFEMVKGGDQVKSWLNEYKIIGHILSNPRLLEEK